MVKHLGFKTQGLKNQDRGHKFEFALRAILEMKGRDIFERPLGPSW